MFCKYLYQYPIFADSFLLVLSTLSPAVSNVHFASRRDGNDIGDLYYLLP